MDIEGRCLHLQFHYDLSDRTLKQRLQLDIALQWFGGLRAFETTPDHSFLVDFGKRLESNELKNYLKQLLTDQLIKEL